MAPFPWLALLIATALTPTVHADSGALKACVKTKVAGFIPFEDRYWVKQVEWALGRDSDTIQRVFRDLEAKVHQARGLVTDDPARYGVPVVRARLRELNDKIIAARGNDRARAQAEYVDYVREVGFGRNIVARLEGARHGDSTEDYIAIIGEVTQDYRAHHRSVDLNQVRDPVVREKIATLLRQIEDSGDHPITESHRAQMMAEFLDFLKRHRERPVQKRVFPPNYAENLRAAEVDLASIESEAKKHLNPNSGATEKVRGKWTIKLARARGRALAARLGFPAPAGQVDNPLAGREVVIKGGRRVRFAYPPETARMSIQDSSVLREGSILVQEIPEPISRKVRGEESRFTVGKIFTITPDQIQFDLE